MGNLIAADTRNRTGWNSVERWPIRVAGRAQRPWVCLVIGGWLKKSVGWIRFLISSSNWSCLIRFGAVIQQQQLPVFVIGLPLFNAHNYFLPHKVVSMFTSSLDLRLFLVPCFSLFFSPNESLDYVLGEPRRRAFRFIDSIRPIFSICFSFRFTIKQTGECVQYIYFFIK